MDKQAIYKKLLDRKLRLVKDGEMIPIGLNKAIKNLSSVEPENEISERERLFKFYKELSLIIKKWENLGITYAEPRV